MTFTGFSFLLPEYSVRESIDERSTNNDGSYEPFDNAKHDNYVTLAFSYVYQYCCNDFSAWIRMTKRLSVVQLDQ